MWVFFFLYSQMLNHVSCSSLYNTHFFFYCLMLYDIFQKNVFQHNVDILFHVDMFLWNVYIIDNDNIILWWLFLWFIDIFFYSYSSIKFLQINLLVVFTFSIFKQNVALDLSHFITDFGHDVLTILSFEWKFHFFFLMWWICFVFIVASFIIIFITHTT